MVKKTNYREVSLKMIYIIRLHDADCEPIIPLSANPTKWSNTLRQLFGNLPTNCLSVFDHFVKLVLKGLRKDSLLKFHKSDIRSKIGLKKISLRRTRTKKRKLKILRIWMFGIVWVSPTYVYVSAGKKC